MGPPRRSVPLFSFERKEKRKNIMSNRLFVYFFIFFLVFSLQTLNIQIFGVQYQLWCRHLGGTLLPLPSPVFGREECRQQASLPRGGGGGMTHYSVGSAGLQYVQVQCRSYTTLHYTTLHNTALHYTLVFYNQVFCGLDLHPSQQTARLRSHTLVFQIMDLYGTTVNSLA